MMQNTRICVNRVAGLVVAALVVMVTAVACRPPDRTKVVSDKAVADAESYPAPTFSAPLLSDPSRQVSPDSYKGKVALVDFWATWCAPCRREIPTLNKLYEEFSPRGFEVIGMTVDRGEPSAIARSIQSLGVRYPTVLAGPDIQRAFGEIRVVPTKFLIDREGAIRKFYQGIVPEEVLRNDIEALLAL